MYIHQSPPEGALDINADVLDAWDADSPLGATQEELEDLAEHNSEMADHAGGEDTEVKQAAGHGKKREKVFEILKDGARGAAKAVAGADKLRAKAGVASAKLRAGVVPASTDSPEVIGPVEFSARHDGLKGFVYVNSGAEEPFVAFNRSSINTEGDRRTVWLLKVDEIARLRKHSGYGMKAKLVTGWATNSAIHDSLRIVDKEGKSWIVTAMPYRDALFNRLCAISQSANWEVC